MAKVRWEGLKDYRIEGLEGVGVGWGRGMDERRDERLENSKMGQ